MSSYAQMLGFARERLAARESAFAITGAQGVAVSGVFPAFVISATPGAPDLKRRELPLLFSFTPIMGKNHLTLVPGVIGTPGGNEVPEIGGEGIFLKPRLTKYAEGGFVWLRRKITMTLEDVSGIDGSFNPISWKEAVAAFDGTTLEIVSTPASQADPDTKFTASAYWISTIDGPAYDYTTISPATGYVHELLCVYNNHGSLLRSLIGGAGNVVTPGDPQSPPGILFLIGGFSSHLINADSLAAYARTNITSISPA